MCKVSVIIPYYNSETTILRALNSVKNQTFKDYEIILVNDGSKDNSENIVKDFINSNPHIRIKNLNEINSGPSAARNLGIEVSKGEYIAFLDSDDSFQPNKLELQIDFMERNKDVFITSTNYFIKNGDKLIIKYAQDKEYVEASFYKMLFKFFFCIPTTVIRKEVFHQGLFFKVGKDYAEDHLLFLEIARKYRGVRLPMPLSTIYKFEFGQGGLSENLNELKVNEYENFKILYGNNKNSTKKINVFFIILLFLLPI